MQAKREIYRRNVKGVFIFFIFYRDMLQYLFFFFLKNIKLLLLDNYLFKIKIKDQISKTIFNEKSFSTYQFSI